MSCLQFLSGLWWAPPDTCTSMKLLVAPVPTRVMASKPFIWQNFKETIVIHSCLASIRMAGILMGRRALIDLLVKSQPWDTENGLLVLYLSTSLKWLSMRLQATLCHFSTMMQKKDPFFSDEWFLLDTSWVFGKEETTNNDVLDIFVTSQLQTPVAENVHYILSEAPEVVLQIALRKAFGPSAW